jgi:DNA-binding MarR family transcriptional regulator
MNSSSRNPKSTGAGNASGSKAAANSSSGTSVSPTQKKAARVFMGMLDILRDGLNDPTLSSQTISVFLTVSTKTEPMGVVELGAEMGISRSTSSRIIQQLGDGSRERASNGTVKVLPGLGLVEAYEDPLNWSRKLVKITPKGVRLIAAMETKLLTGIRTLET